MAPGGQGTLVNVCKSTDTLSIPVLGCSRGYQAATSPRGQGGQGGDTDGGCRVLGVASRAIRSREETEAQGRDVPSLGHTAR